MSRSLLHLVLRHAEGIASIPEAEPDGELLRRFVRTREETAFAELLRRHGPMVWAVCRQSLADDADAEDAFQATFLALIRSARSVRSGSAIAGWLHGVAVRIALKVKRSAARRRQREERVAAGEADCPVPEATWDALLAAVHEEVQQLPDALRTAFVLCELEGVRQPEAAARLGWKAGTLTGRLTRARQLLIERLSKRGLAPALAGGSLGLGVATATAAVPLGLIDKALSLTNAGGAVSPAILNLVREATPMMIRTKLAAAALVLAGGLSAVLFPMANAQQPATGGAPPGLGAGGPPGFGGGQPGAPGSGGGPGLPPGGGAPMPPGMAGGMAALRPQWEYKFVIAAFPAKEFVQLFTELGNDGWEYCGTQEFDKAQLAEAIKAYPDRFVLKPGSQTALIFKRSKGGVMRGGAMGGFGGGAMGPMGGGGGFGVPGMAPVAPGGAQPPMGGGAPGGAGGNPNFFPGSNSGSSTRPGGGGASSGSTTTAPAQSLIAFKLKEASAPEIGVLLEKVFHSGITVATDERTNSIIIRTDEKTLTDVKALIEKLDVSGGKPSKPAK